MFRWRRTVPALGSAALGTLAYLASCALAAEERSVQSTGLQALVADIRHQAKRRDAHVGVSLIHLESGAQADFNGDDLFPLASTYKVPMAATALSRVDDGELTLDQMFDILEESRVVSSVITQSLPHPGVSLSLHNILDLMMRESDNTATDVLLDIINGPEAVMQWLRQAGFEGLRIDRSTAQLLRQFAGIPDPGNDISFVDQMATLEGDPRLQTYYTDGSGEQYRKFVNDPQDQGTPNAMSRLLAGLWRGELLSPGSTRVLQEMMLHCETGNARLNGGLPKDTPVSHKSGTVAGTVNDVGVITLPNGRGQLVISVYVKNAIGDRTEHERLIANISRTAYDYFVAEDNSHP